MKYTAHQHRAGVIKVETRDRVICDCIGDLATAELIATALNSIDLLIEAERLYTANLLLAQPTPDNEVGKWINATRDTLRK